jgi:hypothetical protein
MPGLLRGVARTAVVAGTATAVSGRVQRRQAEKFAGRDANIYAQREEAYQQQTAPPQPQPVYAPPPPPVQAAPAPPAYDGGDDMLEQLERLGRLRDQGVLTEAEFAVQKAKILAG